MIVELNTTEHLHRSHSKRLKYLDIPIQYVALNVSLQVNFNYYLKLSELQFSIIGDSVIFNVPDLYLVTPVAFESSTFNLDCHSSLFSSCEEINTQLMSELSDELEYIGKEKIPSIYDIAAKSLAENFDHFANTIKPKIKYKTIVVEFQKEDGSCLRQFSYRL